MARLKRSKKAIQLLCGIVLFGTLLAGLWFSSTSPVVSANHPAAGSSSSTSPAISANQPAASSSTLSANIEPAEGTPESSDPFMTLVHRVFGRSDASRVRVSYTPSDKSFFRFTSDEQQLHIEADGPLSAASGLHRFCLNHGQCTTTWGVTKQLHLPTQLPPLPPPQAMRTRPFSWVSQRAASSRTL